MVASSIRGHIDTYEKYMASLHKEEKEAQDFDDPYHFGHVHLGSRKRPVSLAYIEDANKDDLAFKNFRKRLQAYLTIVFQSLGLPLPEGRSINLATDHEVSDIKLCRTILISYLQIQECQSLKLTFESTVTWRLQRQILHVAESFYHKKRTDAVLVRSADGTHFPALLQYAFICKIGDDPCGIALIQALDAPIGPTRRHDRQLQLTRLRERPRQNCELIPVESIVRGILVVPSFDKDGDHMLLDVLDPDMMYRMDQGIGGLKKTY